MAELYTALIARIFSRVRFPRKAAVLRVVCGIGKHELHSSSFDELKIGVPDAAPILGEDLDSRRLFGQRVLQNLSRGRDGIRYSTGALTARRADSSCWSDGRVLPCDHKRCGPRATIDEAASECQNDGELSVHNACAYCRHPASHRVQITPT